MISEFAQNSSEKFDSLKTLTVDCFNSSLSLDTIGALSFNASAKKSTSFGCSFINKKDFDILSEYSENGIKVTNSCKAIINSLKSSEEVFVLVNISDLCLFNSSKANTGEYKLCPAINSFLINEPFQKNVNREFVSTTKSIYNISLDLRSLSLLCLANSPSLSASSSLNSESSSNLSIFLSNNNLFALFVRNSLTDSDQFTSGIESRFFFNSSGIDKVMFGISGKSPVYPVKDVDIFKLFALGMEIEVYDYSIPKMSSSCLGENILTLDCSLSALSPEKIAQLNLMAKAKYGESLKFNLIASGNLSKNSDDGIKVICFLINDSVSIKSFCEIFVLDNNLSIFSSSSYDKNSGAINSNLLNILLASNTSKQLPLFISAENTTFTSTTNNIYSLSDLNSLSYLLASDILTSSDNLLACSSVNLDFETIFFNLANSLNSSFNFLESNNCQFTLLANASSFNSSGMWIVTSAMNSSNKENYINVAKDGVSPILIKEDEKNDE